MAVLLEGAASPEMDVCTKSPEASEKPLRLGAVTISILYKIMLLCWGNQALLSSPTGQGYSYRRFYYLSPLLLALLMLYKLTLLAQSRGGRLSVLPGSARAQPVWRWHGRSHLRCSSTIRLRTGGARRTPSLKYRLRL